MRIVISGAHVGWAITLTAAAIPVLYFFFGDPQYNEYGSAQNTLWVVSAILSVVAGMLAVAYGLGSIIWWVWRLIYVDEDLWIIRIPWWKKK